MYLDVATSKSSDKLYEVSWDRNVDIDTTGKVYLICISPQQSEENAAAASCADGGQEWIAVLRRTASKKVELDITKVRDDCGELLVTVMECGSIQHEETSLGSLERAESYCVDRTGSQSLNSRSTASYETLTGYGMEDLNRYFHQRLSFLSGTTPVTSVPRTQTRQPVYFPPSPCVSLQLTDPQQSFIKPSYAYGYPGFTTLSTACSVSVEIERERHDQATVVWSYSGKATKWQITVQELGSLSFLSKKKVYFVESHERKLQLQQPLKPRTKYEVTVKALQMLSSIDDTNRCDLFVIVSQQTKDFFTVLSKAELRQLLQRAIRSTKYFSTLPCKVLYRNKSPAYFHKIFLCHDGVMKPYIKDDSGDPLSPINGRIKGLFFMAEVQPGTEGEPCSKSAFGSTRLIVPVQEMLRMAPNLYFSDYYCMKGINHYITLVMTRPGSEADEFCHEYLIPLSLTDRENNTFFYEDESGNTRVTSSVKVELLFTENIDINHLTNNCGAQIVEKVELIGKGYTTPGGIPKKLGCPLCNLYPSRQRYHSLGFN